MIKNEGLREAILLRFTASLRRYCFLFFLFIGGFFKVSIECFAKIAWFG
jgi:hypothetical protein